MRSVRTPEAPAGAAWVTPFTTREFGGRRKSAMGFSAFSVGARPGRNRHDFARHGVEMHRAVVEGCTPRPLDAYQRVLAPARSSRCGKSSRACAPRLSVRLAAE